MGEQPEIYTLRGWAVVLTRHANSRQMAAQTSCLSSRGLPPLLPLTALPHT